MVESILKKVQDVEKECGKVLTLEKAAEYLGIDTGTVCMLVKSGELEAMKVENSYMFKPIQLVKFELDSMTGPEIIQSPVVEREVDILKVTEGSTYETKSEKSPYEMSFYITFDDGEKIRAKVRGSKEELLHKKQEKIIEELEKHRKTRNRMDIQQPVKVLKKHTFREVSEMWYKEFKYQNESRGNSYSNIEGAKYALKVVNSVIGEMDIRKIDKRAAQEMINTISLDSKGGFRSKSYVEKAMRKFKSVMEYALEEGYIDRQIGKLDMNRNLKVPNKDDRFIDKDLLKELLTCVKENPFYNALINLILSTGLRQEEALALTIDDIKERDGMYQIYVSKALVEQSYHNYAIIDRLKHGEKARYVAIAKEVYEMVIDYYNESIKNIELMEKRKQQKTDRLLFVNKEGCIHNKRTLYYSFRKYLERNMKCDSKIRLHMLRHTFASLMKAEIPIEMVSEMLGHKDVSTTIKFYASQTMEDYQRSYRGTEEMMRKIKE